MLEAHVHDLNAELDSERKAYEEMEAAKDEIIEAVKTQLEGVKATMAEELSRTSLELAEGSAQVSPLPAFPALHFSRFLIVIIERTFLAGRGHAPAHREADGAAAERQGAGRGAGP